MSLDATANLEFSLEETQITALRPSSLVSLSNGVRNRDSKIFPATSGTSTTAVQFQINVPDGHIIDPEINLSFPCRFYFGGTNAVANEVCLKTGQWSMSQFAMYHLVNSITVNINGASLTKQIADIMPVLSQYMDCSVDNPKLTDQYATPDFVQRFPDLYAAAGVNGIAVGTTGSSPFVPSGLDAYSKYGSRVPIDASGTALDAVVAASAATYSDRTLNVNLQMSLPWSIFSYAGREPGLANVNQFTVTLNLNSEHMRCFSFLPAMTENINVSRFEFASVPEVSVSFIAPSEFIMSALKGPKGGFVAQTYTLAEHGYFPTPVTSLAAGADRTIQSSSIMLSSIPRRIYVAAVRNRTVNKSDGGAAMSQLAVGSTPQCYARLSDVNISLNGVNTNGSLKTYDLYSMSSRNGLSIPYSIANRTGFVVCYDLGEGDIGLGGDQIVGATASVPLQVSAKIKNIDTAAHDYTFVVVTEMDQYLVIPAPQEGPAQIRNTIALDASTKSSLLQLSTEYIKGSARAIGGSFLGTLWRGVTKLAPLLIKHGPQIYNTVKSALASGVHGGRFQASTIAGGVPDAGAGAFQPPPLNSAGAKVKKAAGIDNAPKGSSRII